MPISPAYLQFRLSGGNLNTTNQSSLGGGIAAAALASQQIALAPTIPGVAVNYLGGAAEANASIQFTASSKTLAWKSGSSATWGAAVDVTAGGVFVLYDAVAPTPSLLVVEVDAGLLPTTNETVTGMVANTKNALFDDISREEALLGSTVYRCFYLINKHPTDSFLSTSIIITQPPGADDLAVGIDPIGVCDGVNTAAPTVADQNTAPSGVTFVNPYSDATMLSLGRLDPDECVAIWVRRTTPGNTTVSTPNDYCQFNIKVAY